MDCIYKNNSFCSKLSDELRAKLCTCCTRKRYARGQHLGENYFADKLTLVVEGMLVKMEVDTATQKMTCSGIGCGGSLFSMGDFFDIPQELDENRVSICVTDCVLAIIDERLVRELVGSNVEFVRNCLENCYLFCIREKAVMMRDIGRGDVYSAVHYVVKFCKEHGIEQLTHEQIALVCSRSRPTVTSTIHQLIRREPELFIADSRE